MEEIKHGDLEQYRNDQKEVSLYLRDGAQLLFDLGQEETGKPLDRLRKSVDDSLFSIVLVGEFSAGKSTFLNALMRKYILPSFSGETTATVNFLRYIDKAPLPGLCGRVYRLDGSTEDITDLSVSTLERVVSTRGNINGETVATTVDRVELYLDSDFLHEGVMLVDSPGLNGTADHHREITEQQIKSSYASIFVFNAEHPGTNTDFEYLRYLKSQSNNIFFVLNKIDCIKESEGNTAESIIQGLYKTYHDRFPEEETLPKIWPISSGYALGARDSNFEYRSGEYAKTQEKQTQLEERSRMGDFEKRLIYYLTHGQRAHDQLCEPVEKAIKVFVGERSNLETKIEYLKAQTGGEELSVQQDQLTKELEELKTNRKNISAPIRQEVQRILRDLLERASAKCVGIRSRVNNDLETIEDPEEIRDYASNLDSVIASHLSGLADELSHLLRDELLDILSTEYQNYSDGITDRFSEIYGSVNFQLPESKIIVQEIGSTVDLAQFDQKCAMLQEQINQLSAKEEEAGLTKIAARKRERDLMEAKAELEQLRASKNLIQDTFILPDVEYHDEEVKTKKWRGGLIGIILTPFIGRKEETRIDRVKDDSKRVIEQERYDTRMKELGADIAEAEKRLQGLKLVGSSSEEAELEQLRAQNRRDSLEQELKEIQEKFRSDMLESTHKKCKRMRRDVLGQAESLLNEAEINLRNYLRGQEKQMINAVQELLNQTLRSQIEVKQKQLNDTINMLKTKGEERDNLLAKTEEDMKRVQSIIDRGREILEHLEILMQDSVEEVSLVNV